VDGKKTQQSLEISRRVEHAGRVFEEHEDFIRTVIRFHIKGRTEADDIFQQSFLSLVARPIPENVIDVKGYLYQAITNDVIDAARQAKNYEARIKRYASRSKYSTPEIDTPDTIAIHNEQRQKTLKIIENTLRKCELRAVKLKYKKGYTSEEAAEQMGIKRQSVNRYINSAVRKLRCLLNTPSYRHNTKE
jgi:RNA polymerase sigma factor (sigma-70 family)